MHKIWMAPTEAYKSFDLFLKDIWDQVPKGNQMPGERPRCSFDFLWFSSRALAAYKDEQSNRINIRHRKIENSKGQELFFIQDRFVYDF